MRLAGRTFRIYVLVIVALVAAGFVYQLAGIGGVAGLALVGIAAGGTALVRRRNSNAR